MKNHFRLFFVFACGAVQAQPDIGTYPSTTWASTNLLVNRALEAGAQGQAIGYTAPGVVGPITVSGGGGGSDYNAVASVPDLATLTNSVVGYSKAWVGSTNYAAEHTLWQSGPNGFQSHSGDGYWDTGGTYGDMTWLSDTEVMVETGSTTSSIGIYCQAGAATVNRSYVIAFEARMETPGTFTNSSTQDQEVWTPNTLSTNWQSHTFSFRATVNTGIRILCDPETSTLYLRNIVLYGQEFSNVVSSTTLPHVDPALLWRQVGTVSPGGGAQTTTVALTSDVWNSTIPAVSGTLILDTEQLTSSTMVDLAGQPTFTDGAFVGQTMTVLFPRGNITSVSEIVLRGSGNPNYPLTDLEFIGGQFYLRLTKIAGRNAVNFVWDGEYWYQNWGPLATATPAEQINVLPAPWPPPDENGIQLLPASVKRQLVVELLPYVATNWAQIAPYLVGTNAVTTPP